MWRLTIYGAPRTKKNSGVLGRAGGKPRLFPSRAWSAWLKSAAVIYHEGIFGKGPIAEPVNCEAIFYRDAERGDAVGYYQGLADLLEKAGIVRDDRLIVSWDGSRLAKDAKEPRVEITLRAVTHE